MKWGVIISIIGFSGIVLIFTNPLSTSMERIFVTIFCLIVMFVGAMIGSPLHDRLKQPFDDSLDRMG